LPKQLNQIIHSYVPIGLLVWFMLWLVPEYGMTERMILFAAFAVVPLTLFRVLESVSHTPAFFLNTLIWLLPIGAFALAGSFVLPPGTVSGLLALPWGLVTLCMAALGIHFAGRAANLSDLSRAIGFLYILTGGIGLVAHQLGFPLLGFQGQIMLFTAAHFHYAGFVAPVLFGFLHECMEKKRLSGTVVALGGISPLLVALGIAYSPILEWLSVLVYSLTLILYSLLVFACVIPRATLWTKWFHLLSSGVIWVTMALAVTYGFGEWSGQHFLSLSAMILFHGWGNAVLFCFLGVLAWHATLMDQATAGIPFSRIQGRGTIGANIFAELGVLDPAAEKKPTGLVDNMQAYRGGQFDPVLLDPDIIAFYEHTDEHELQVTPRWNRAFRLPAKAYKAVSQRMEQMNFPLEAENDDLQVKSAILPIRDDKDGREHVRAWVRTCAQSQKAIYAALYSTHVSGGTRYMNIAFPLPYSQLTSVLRLQNGAGRSLVLTSWPDETTPGDQGVYVVLNQKAIRFPINETITVWKSPGSAKGNIEARHEMWLFGVKFLTLEYRIFRKAHGEKAGQTQ